MWKRLLILLCAVITVQSAPSEDFAPCAQNDKDCIVKTANIIYKEVVRGTPSANIETLDPLFFEEINSNLATINYKLTKSTVKGLTDCKVVDMITSVMNSTLHMVFDCPRFDMFGTYEIDGRILTLPIQGKGDFNMECKDYDLVIDSDLKITENDGKSYVSMKTYNYSAELHGGMIDMKNLFNGQKELADAVLKVMNENWLTVANELQGPVVKATVKKIVKNFNKYFKTKPIDGFIVY